MCVCVLSCFSHVQLFATPWTVANQASLSMEFSREEYWSGFPFPSPEHLPDPGMEPTSLVSPAVAGGFSTTSPTWKAWYVHSVKVEVLVAQSCSTLCNPMDSSPPGSSVHWILQVRILEWVAMPSCKGFSRPRY